MNHSLVTADRATHLKIVVLALIAGIGVVAVGLAARVTDPNSTARFQTDTVIVKAGKPAVYTSRDITVR